MSQLPLSWLREVTEEGLAADAAAAALTRAGIEVSGVRTVGRDVAGVVVGRLLSVEPLAGFRKPVSFVEVETGSGSRAVVCGATNIAPGDVVPVALPGARLPGGTIEARRTYGRTSDGMLCSAAELGLGSDHAGILQLPADTPVGVDVAELLRLADEVLEIEVTPDRGYALSVRGVGRELAAALGVAFRDPAEVARPAWPIAGVGVEVLDPSGCDRYLALTLDGVDPAARTPLEIVRRLHLCGLRPVSLVVDVTNYVLVELGAPLHAFDAQTLGGGLQVRRAHPGEALVTLDGRARSLVPDDLVIADSAGPALALAGVLGGQASEIRVGTTRVVLEAAHFEASTVARSARRHGIDTDAGRRFARGVDPALPPAAAARAAELLARHGGARVVGVGEVDTRLPALTIRFPVTAPSRVAGRDYEPAVVRRRLEQVGCAISGGAATGVVEVRPPSWRPDLRIPADLVEEVLRLEGLDDIPAVLPRVPAGGGLSPAQRRARAVSQALAIAGYVEVFSPVFTGPAALDSLGLDSDDPRRAVVRLANPLDADEPLLRPTLLAGLLAVLARNVSRGLVDLAIFETGRVFRARGSAPAPLLEVAGRPSAAELAQLDAALPAQPRHLAVALCGDRELPGWWGPGRPADWADAVAAATCAARAAGADIEVAAARLAPWHPGRCAELRAGGVAIGHAGELHPAVTEALRLPARTCALELDLEALLAAGGRVAGPTEFSPFPPVLLDVALVVPEAVPAARVAELLRAGFGGLCEELRLFDVYTGPQVGPGHRSLAFAVRLRAPDRTLTDAQAQAARDAAVAVVHAATGAVLRGPSPVVA